MSQADEVVVTYRGKPIHFEPIGGSIEKRLRTGHFYEEQLLQYIESLGLDGTYVDVGAFVGTHSLFFAAHCPATRVHAFEPRKRHFDTLRRHVDRNGLADRIALHSEGLSDRDESVSVVLDGRKETLPCRLLDDLVREPVSVMKIDVEGMEEKVLGGAQRILRESQPLLYIEGNTQEEVDRHVALLGRFGYRLTGRVFNASPTYEYAVAGSAAEARLPRALPVTEWQSDSPELDAVRGETGAVTITSRLAAGTHAHVTQAPLNLRIPPDAPLLEGGAPTSAFLQVMGRIAEGTSVVIFVMEYDGKQRTATHRTHFHPRAFERLNLRADTRHLRVTVQVTGPGELVLERVALHVAGRADPATAPPPRRRSWGARVARATRVALRQWLSEYRKSD